MSQKEIQFVSLVPYLIDKRGHLFIYQLCLKEAIESHNIDYIGYISSESTLSADFSSVWQKWFSNAERPFGYWRRLIRRYRDFTRAIGSRPTSGGRIFFIDMFYRLDLIALCLAAVIHSRPTDSFWVLFRHPLPPAKMDLYRVLGRIMHRKLRHRLKAITDSEKIKNSFGDLPFSPAVWPIPHTRHILPEESTQTPETIICWWPGPPREEKGWETIRRLPAIQDPTSHRFTIVAARAAQLSPGVNNLSIALIENELSEEEFTQKLAECQFVFLPYDPEQYYARTSGIFVESVIAHKIPLVKDGSWLADELKRYDLYELIVDWDREDFFAHVFSLFYDEKIRKKLDIMQRSYAEYHCLANYQAAVYQLLHKR